MNSKKITRPATAVLLAKNTLAESFSSSNRTFLSVTVTVAIVSHS